jgi:hypothetical protein
MVESALYIDMRMLRRLGLLRAGECVHDTVRWSNGGLRVAEARLRVDLSDIDAATITITADIPHSPVRQRIAVEALPCRFGGHRFYFLCPDDGHRCEVLYLRLGRFASRRAHSLGYAVQSMDELSRVRRRRRKLRERLDGKGLTPRPRGANRYAFVMRLTAIQAEERALHTNGLRVVLKNEARRALNPRSGAQ